MIDAATAEVSRCGCVRGRKATVKSFLCPVSDFLPLRVPCSNLHRCDTFESSWTWTLYQFRPP